MYADQLQTLLAYRNENVISRFTDQFAMEEAAAEDIFTETLKFLYICRTPGVFIPDELLIVDEMWHNFILFTKAYQAFCEQHFGQYIHHLPASRKEKYEQRERDAADPAAAAAAFKDKLQPLMGIVYDQLGPGTLLKWFTIYPKQYSKASIRDLRKW